MLQVTGNTMPQNVMNPTGRRRRGVHHDTRKANTLVNGHTVDPGLVNGDFVHKDGAATVSGTNDGAPVGTVHGFKPCSMVNGAMPAARRGKRAAPSKMLRKKGRMNSAAGMVNSVGIPADVKVNGATCPGTAGLLNGSDKVAPEQNGNNKSAPAKNWRPRSEFWRKKRDKDLAPPPPPMAPPRPPQEEEEDWENEIQEVTITDWEKMSFGIKPYGPEDVLSFALRDFSLTAMDTVSPPVTANYSPAWHHPRPVRWSCHNIPSEPGQFADADEHGE